MDKLLMIVISIQVNCQCFDYIYWQVVHRELIPISYLYMLA